MLGNFIPTLFDPNELTAFDDARFTTNDLRNMITEAGGVTDHSKAVLLVERELRYDPDVEPWEYVTSLTYGGNRVTKGYILNADQVVQCLSALTGEPGIKIRTNVRRYLKDLRGVIKAHEQKLVSMESALVAAKETWAKNQANALRVTALVRMLVNDGKLDMSEKTLAENFKSGIKYDVDWARGMYERYGKKYDGKQNVTAFIDQCLSEEFAATVAPRIELVAEHQTKYQPLKLRPANQAP